MCVCVCVCVCGTVGVRGWLVISFKSLSPLIAAAGCGITSYKCVCVCVRACGCVLMCVHACSCIT